MILFADRPEDLEREIEEESGWEGNPAVGESSVEIREKELSTKPSKTDELRVV